MKNPFLARLDVGGLGHGRKSEKRIAKDIGARLHPASGAKRGSKSDASLKNFRLEMKSTVQKTLKLELGWLVKISQEAVSHRQVPGLVFSFVDAEGKPVMKSNAQWVAMPLASFEELVNDKVD